MGQHERLLPCGSVSGEHNERVKVGRRYRTAVSQAFAFRLIARVDAIEEKNARNTRVVFRLPKDGSDGSITGRESGKCDRRPTLDSQLLLSLGDKFREKAGISKRGAVG